MGKDRPRPRRRWWQRLIRLAVLVALAAGAAYVTLPWWVPRGWLREELKRRLSETAGVGVHLSDVRLSWADGVEISGFVVDGPGEPNAPPLAAVRSLRADFSPLDLLRGRLAWMELEGPRLFLRVSERGEVDLEPISRLLKSDVRVERISIRRAAVFLRVPQRAEPFCLDVSDVQVLAGRMYPVGRVTLAAGLSQHGSLAPVSLRFSEGPRDANLLGRATLFFRGLDLEGLALHRLFRLPLRKLSGLASGDLELRASIARGQIDQFQLDINVHGLDMQPLAGPELPVIDQAFVKLSAAFDMGGRLNLKSAEVRLPGMDLRGSAEAWLDPYGRWDRLSRLELDGTIRPEQLAALVAGGEEANDFPLSGPVDVHFAGTEPSRPAYAGATLSLEANFRATDAVLRRNGRTLKPAGRTMEVSLAGGLDPNDWTFSGGAEIALGDNRFGGEGTLADLRGLLGRLRDANRPWRAKDLPAAMTHLHWGASWRLRDLASLADLLPEAAGLLRPLELAGEITGECHIRQKDGGDFVLKAALPRGTRLAVPGVLTKPADEEVRLTLTALLDPERGAWRDVDLQARAGEGAFHLFGGSVSLAEGNVLSAGGRWDVRRVESFLKMLDPSARPAVELTGAMEGTFSLDAGPAGVSAALEVKADHAAIVAGDAWNKPAGEPALCKVKFSGRLTPSGWMQPRLAAEYHGPKADFSAKIEPRDILMAFVGSTAPGRAAEFRADLRDAAWLLESSPRLAKLMEGGRLKGPARFGGTIEWLGDDWSDGNVVLEADGLDFALPGGSVLKPAGMTLGASADFKWRGIPSVVGDANWGRLIVNGGKLAAGSCGAGFFLTDMHLPLDWHTRLQDVPGLLTHVRGDFDVELDGNAARIVPALAPILHEHGIEGKAGAGGSFSLAREGDSFGVWFYGGLDLTELAIRSAGPISKPAGMPAELWTQFVIPLGDPNVDVRSVRARIGDANLVAGGKATLSLSDAGVPQLVRLSGSASVFVPDAAQLTKLIPALARPDPNGGWPVHDPNGSFAFSAEWADDGNELAVPKAELRSAGMEAEYRGRRVYLAGNLRAEGVIWNAEEYARAVRAAALQAAAIAAGAGAGSAPMKADCLHIAKLSTDGLEFRAGENHGWVVADLAGLTEANIVGRVRVLAELLDDQDLARWLGDPNAPGPAQPGEAGPPPAKGRLPEHEVARLEEKARGLIASLRKAIERAELDVRIEIDRFRTFDAGVAQSYEARQMVMAALASGGRLRLDTAGGIGGGTFRKTQETSLLDAAPTLVSDTVFLDVLASPSTRAQLSRFFPGNTVHGSFNHSEKLTMPLASAVANMLDPRAPLRASGHGEMTAISGVMEGRAAPEFVTFIFPGLNTAKYRYNRMKAFSNTLPDGTVENDMIFSGESYDVYMEGTTDADRIARYETGLILLSPPQTPELNHDLKLGRIPILKIEARIEGGKLYDMKVSYPLPTETAFIIAVRNNPFYRLWLTWRKK